MWKHTDFDGILWTFHEKANLEVESLESLNRFDGTVREYTVLDRFVKVSESNIPWLIEAVQLRREFVRAEEGVRKKRLHRLYELLMAGACMLEEGK